MNLKLKPYRRKRILTKSSSLLDSLNGVAIDSDNISVIGSPSDFHAKLIELINKAQQRIYLAALYIQDDSAGKEVLDCLYQAKQKNPSLDIKIFVDFLRAQRGLMGQQKSIGNIRLYQECAQKYHHQIDILGVPVKSKEVFGVLHLKGFIFDDVLLYSGASINDVYLKKNHRYRLDRYHLIKDQTLCDSMVNFLKAYLTDLSIVKSLTKELTINRQLKNTVKKLKKNLQFAAYQFTSCQQQLAENQLCVTPLVGFGVRNNLLNQVIYQLLKNAQNEITIYTPYFNFPRKVAHAVKRLLKRGGKVNLVVGDKTANDFYIPPTEKFTRIGIVPYIYESNLRKFLKTHQQYIESQLLNVYLWSHENNSFHLKGIMRDKIDYLITGHNFNPRAWRLDLENGVLIRDPQQLLDKMFSTEYSNILQHTKKLRHFSEIETIKDYPEAVAKLLRSVKRAKLDSILNRIL